MCIIFSLNFAQIGVQTSENTRENANIVHFSYKNFFKWLFTLLFKYLEFLFMFCSSYVFN